MSQRTNILYLTTKCNLECEYCYESSKRNEPGFEHFTVTREQIDEFMEVLEFKEGNVKSTSVVVMGGDPSLALDEYFYFCDKLIESGKKLGKEYYGIFTTNGVLLNNEKYYKDFMERWNKNDEKGKGIVRWSLEISYDHIGQYLRCFPNGKDSTEIVASVLGKLERDKMTYRISATVTEANWDKLVEESIYFFEKYEYINHLSFSFAFQRLDTHFRRPGFGFKLKSDYEPVMNELYKIYKIPICGLACEECQECDNSNFEGNRYLSPTTGITIADSITNKEFRQF